MTIQGQRVISTTGIKCVGNTVILHGIPYSPPYGITAVGDPAAMVAALDDSGYVDVYLEYVADLRARLGRHPARRVELPAYEGPSTWSTHGPPERDPRGGRRPDRAAHLGAPASGACVPG